MTVEPRCWGGGGVSHPLQLTTVLVIKSITTSPTLAGEHMLFILQVSILSEQTLIGSFAFALVTNRSVRAVFPNLWSYGQNGPWQISGGPQKFLNFY